MKKILLTNAKIVMENEILEGNLLIEDKIIKKIGNFDFKLDEIAEIIDLKSKFIIPGFIDVHIHGANGSDVMDGDIKGLKNISKFLGTKGVTNFLPTTLTGSKEELIKALSSIKELKDKDIGGANIFGVHMEGPCFDIEYKGAQNKKYIKSLSKELFKKYLQVEKGLVKMVSLSPHKEESLEVIKYLKDNNIIISVGHSGATYDEVKKATEVGLSHSTHTYNGMKGFNHREPGVVGAVLTLEKINAEIIFDKIHVHPVAVKLLIDNKGVDKVICITDSISATNLKDGYYKLGGLEIYVKDGSARLKTNNSLAGSLLTMNRAFKNIMELGYSIFDAVKMTSTNAAKEFKLNTGEIKEGKIADITILDKEYNVFKTIVKGKIIF